MEVDCCRLRRRRVARAIPRREPRERADREEERADRERSLGKLRGRRRCAHRRESQHNNQDRDPPHADPLSQSLVAPSQASPLYAEANLNRFLQSDIRTPTAVRPGVAIESPAPARFRGQGCEPTRAGTQERGRRTPGGMEGRDGGAPCGQLPSRARLRGTPPRADRPCRSDGRGGPFGRSGVRLHGRDGRGQHQGVQRRQGGRKPAGGCPCALGRAKRPRPGRGAPCPLD